MRINKQTAEYIGSLVDKKAAKKLAEFVAKRDAIDKKRDALRTALNAEIDKVLAEAAKKVSAICRKNGVSPRDWSDEETEVELHVVDIKTYHSKLDEEYLAANTEVKKFKDVVEQKKTEVIARLSLGGTAADLDEIIGAIEF